MPASVLIEPSGYDLRNVGDNAMLATTLERVAERGEVEVGVVTSSPRRLAILAPDADPVCARQRQEVLSDRRVRAALRVSPRLGRVVAGRRHPRNEFLERLNHADALVFSGAGALTDAFYDHALTWFTQLALARGTGTPTGLFGQGLGPIEGEHLRNAARWSLQTAGFIGLREAVSGHELLDSLGVRQPKISTTGDDALQLITPTAPPPIGTRVGFNVRASNYSGVDRREAASILAEVRRSAEELGAGVLGVAVSEHAADDDRENGKIPYIANCLEPASLAVQIGQSVGTMVTGSYHAAVFALANGIPVVAIVGSDYYRHKFEGLKGQFPAGAVLAHDVHATPRAALGEQVKRQWAMDLTDRRAIHECAVSQAHKGRAFYDEELAALIG